MRAAFMTDVNVVEVRDDAPEPELDPAGALLRVEACGICGTDARTFFNGDPKAPSPWQLGHEPVGVLERGGPEADLPPGVAAGDRVFLGSILTCGDVPVVRSRASRTCASTTCCTATTRSPAPTRRWPPCRRSRRRT